MWLILSYLSVCLVMITAKLYLSHTMYVSMNPSVKPTSDLLLVKEIYADDPVLYAQNPH